MSRQNPLTENFIYKIRNPKTNTYSSGGMKPKWNKGGKIWSLAHLNSHLSQFYDKQNGMLNQGYPYADCEIIKIKVVYENPETLDCDLHMAALRLKRLGEN